MHDDDHRIGDLPELHHREFIDPCILLLFAARKRCAIKSETLALALPGACNVQTPPVSQCNAAAPATTPPAESPNATPDDSPSTPSVPGNPTPTSTATPNAPSGNGSKTVPGRSGQSSDGSSNVFSLSALLLLLSIAAFPSFY
ncbi:hypothetical protein QJS10_CPA10g00753 [Acorus calamus]|uniref:Uncharacterized protein n=1 Tax=Acorus calamus TaxID=4465 RepID=A0AAV9DY73_ACOCL|nr:hypothetical protein QJS10_CPA10g00753 [Acorus calamus]